jgi:hypothetical protein
MTRNAFAPVSSRDHGGDSDAQADPFLDSMGLAATSSWLSALSQP